MYLFCPSCHSKKLILKSSKERLSLRTTCRVFGVSFNWLLAFARINWSQAPKDLGLNQFVITQIKKLQVFGIQADELWSFVREKSPKRWIWVAYDPVHHIVVRSCLFFNQVGILIFQDLQV